MTGTRKHNESQKPQLAILGGTPTALAVARDASRHDVATVVIDIDRGPVRHSRAVDRFVQCGEHRDALPYLQELGVRDWIIADSDHWLRFIIDYRDVIGDATVLHPANDVIEVCLAKHQFARWCTNAGFLTPAVIDANDSNVPYPVVVRPNHTRHGDAQVPKACVARNGVEFDEVRSRYDSAAAEFVTTEALIDASTRYFSVGLARRPDGETLSFATEKIRPPVERCRGASFITSCDVPEVCAIATQIAGELNFVGVGEFEFASRNGEFSIVELNPRPWLQYGLGAAMGIRLIGFLALGEQRSDARRDATWIDIGSDVYWCLSRSEGLVWNSRLRLSQFLRQALFADCRPLWSWRDPLPAIWHFSPFSGS